MTPISIDGVLLLDKPLGMSSTAAGQRVRRLLRIDKVGHVGSLDPLASGMLPLCLGEATKLAGEILEGDKVYRFTISLGAATSTGDREGEIIETQPVPLFDAAQIARVLEGFVGESLQTPPMYSAIKQDGQPLYRLARAGKTVERQPRPIRIERLDLVGQPEPHALDCRVTCGKGTYVRVLAEDIARKLGTVGHVSLLRRERVAPFESAQMVDLATVEECARQGLPLALVGLSEAVAHLPLVRLDEAGARRICQGQEVVVPGLAPPMDQVLRLEDAAARFLGLGRVAGVGRIAAKRLVRQGSHE
ncbi:MAG: tRNA pseudouridine(55) synthase TruB [Pseudomonadota bacterium]|mgnify:FL=1